MTRRPRWMRMGMALIALAAAGTFVAAEEKPGKDGVFIHISHGPEDAHRVLMGLNMASMMAEDHDVLIYFDINGVEVVLKDAPDIVYSPFTTSKLQIRNLLARGVILMACPGCLNAAGKTPEDLAQGVQAADKSRFFSFTQGRILTLDY